MELLVIEGAVTWAGPFIDLSDHYYEVIHVDMEKNGHKKPQDIYDEWLRENPEEERIDNPTFFIGWSVRGDEACFSQGREQKIP
jgi:hypothetical protein